VETHRSHIMTKMRVKSVADLVRISLGAPRPDPAVRLGAPRPPADPTARLGTPAPRPMVDSGANLPRR
jgi:two-component system response regulator FixJ